MQIYIDVEKTDPLYATIKKSIQLACSNQGIEWIEKQNSTIDSQPHFTISVTNDIVRMFRPLFWYVPLFEIDYLGLEEQEIVSTLVQNIETIITLQKKTSFRLTLISLTIVAGVTIWLGFKFVKKV